MSQFCKYCKRNAAYSEKQLTWKGFTFCDQACQQAYADKKKGIKEIISINTLIYPALFGLVSGSLGLYGLFSGRAFMPELNSSSSYQGTNDSFWVTKADPSMYWTVILIELGLFLFMVIACVRHYLKNKHKIRFEN